MAFVTKQTRHTRRVPIPMPITGTLFSKRNTNETFSACVRTNADNVFSNRSRRVEYLRVFFEHHGSNEKQKRNQNNRQKVE